MQALDLDVPLLSDWNGEAVRGFEVSQSYRGMLDVPLRTAFLIDREGRVQGSWSYENEQVPDFDELLAAARAL
jgi:peroxiredoxin